MRTWTNGVPSPWPEGIPLPTGRAAEVMQMADKQVNVGYDVHFKWTCQNCMSRQTMETANVIHATGTCEECKHETDLMSCQNLGFLLIVRTRHPQ